VRGHKLWAYALTLTVPQALMGRIIGRQGRRVKAIEKLLSTLLGQRIKVTVQSA
jgi:predicted RNA-binding protein YlqC (UPF0109 family)